MEFVKQFNAKSVSAVEKGTILPVVITVYADRSFSFILKTPPAAVLIKKKLGLDKGSPTPNKQKVGKITRKQIEEIAKVKMPDLTAGSLEAAMACIAGSAKSMGVEIID
jgi:large subunit ribosomal protein L11